ncbi:hypothetical protein SAMN04487904_103434 [Actinopolyspora lacussalsi subsp. righensis]|uniref:DUF5753 domain-containing protein n=1 Tax=Actinopolyspora righensis TaxID=995060 RepID=A0A1I6YZV5_9ACTN|nr:Scr1 family TA system antitoxin-like transcriptional regulator [Actinopolyspora righensis]SFT55954.1 hypothetical protein SAMN04487904_103434 [Actinopolyspora righensis]
MTLTGQFTVLDFEQVRSIVYSELHDGAVYIQDEEQVDSYTMAAESLQRVALGPEQSRDLIEDMLKA